jgi:nicotinamidase-related amidase
MTARAVLVIDLQNEYFPSGKLPLVGIEAATANAARVIADARAKGVPGIHVRHEAARPDAPVFTPGTPNVQIHASVAPVEGEALIVKHFPNSFRETPLQALLEEGGVRELTIVGAMSHMCIDAGTRAAADLGYAVTVVHDACATRDLVFGEQTVPAAQVHAAFMSALGSYATLSTTEALLAR